MPEERKRRVSITKSQRETAAGVELISLCQTMTDDGSLSVEEVGALRQWLVDNKDTDLPAKDFLSETVERILADGKVTPEECNELYAAIEKVLPPDIREYARGKRRAVEEGAREARKAEEIEERKSNLPLETWDFMVAGCRFEGRPPVICQHAHRGDVAYLARDPGNQYSRNAVEVRLGNGMQIGFVPEKLAAEIAPLLDKGHPHEAHIKKILTGGRSPIPVVVASLYPTLADRPGLCAPSQVPAKVLPAPVAGPARVAPGATFYCDACGVQLTAGIRYCTKCGKEQRQMSTPPAASLPPRPPAPAAHVPAPSTQAKKGSGCLIIFVVIVLLCIAVSILE